MATNLTEMNGIPAGALCRCSARATNSLPVPDSPVTTAVRSQLAAVSIWRASSCIAGESPIMPTLLSFDSEFTFLFSPGEICGSIGPIYQRQQRALQDFPFDMNCLIGL